MDTDKDAQVDNAGVDALAAAMKAKLAQKRQAGYSGWDDREACPSGRLSRMLLDHVAKGDPVDIANFAMMLHARGERVVVDNSRDYADANQLIDDIIAGLEFRQAVGRAPDPLLPPLQSLRIILIRLHACALGSPNYGDIRRDLARMSGVPMMSITATDHLKLIEDQLHEARRRHAADRQAIEDLTHDLQTKTTQLENANRWTVEVMRRLCAAAGVDMSNLDEPSIEDLEDEIAAMVGQAKTKADHAKAKVLDQGKTAEVYAADDWHPLDYAILSKLKSYPAPASPEVIERFTEMRTKVHALNQQLEQSMLHGGESHDAYAKEAREHQATKGALQAALERAKEAEAKVEQAEARAAKVEKVRDAAFNNLDFRREQIKNLRHDLAWHRAFSEGMVKNAADLIDAIEAVQCWQGTHVGTVIAALRMTIADCQEGPPASASSGPR